MALYKTGNPVPSSAMPDVWDNNRVQDEILNSEELEVETRTGIMTPTWKGVLKKNEDEIEETRQNLIPLSKQYMTIEAAQADIANIPAGSTTYVRSQDGRSLADEYINLAGTLQPTGRRMLRDDYGYQVSPDSVALAGYDPETKRVAPFLNTDGRLIQIGPDGKYYELLTPQEAELYALGSEGKVTQFIGGEKVWRMIVDAATNQIVEAYTVGGHHWIYSDSGLVLVNQE
ncbi:sialate O-acetylesterase, partial [Klebsiella pneumoniae]